MRVYKEHYAPIEDVSTYDTTKTFNDIQSHIFSIDKKRRLQKKNEFDEYLKIPVASIDTDILLWWKVSLFFCKIDLIFTNRFISENYRDNKFNILIFLLWLVIISLYQVSTYTIC